MSYLRIAEVAARSGVPASTLRYYDQVGLVPSGRLANGYRSYSESVFDRLRFIDCARKLDLPLAEIAGLLRTWEADPCRSVKAALRPMLAAQLATVDDAVDGLTELRDHLLAARAHLDKLPERDGRCDPSCAFLVGEPVPAPTCRLGAERTGQQQRWRALLDGLDPTAVERLPGGVRYRLPVDALAEAAALAVAEQACCPFFRFTFSLHHDTFTLTLQAPPEGLSLLAEITGMTEGQPT